MVRLDASGNKLWDRSFGGNQGDYLSAVRQALDGGFILAGGSSSDPGTGNKTSAHFGNLDEWVVRLSPELLT